MKVETIHCVWAWREYRRLWSKPSKSRAYHSGNRFKKLIATSKLNVANCIVASYLVNHMPGKLTSAVRFLSRRASLVFAMAAETMPNEGSDPHSRDITLALPESCDRLTKPCR